MPPIASVYCKDVVLNKCNKKVVLVVADDKVLIHFTVV